MVGVLQFALAKIAFKKVNQQTGCFGTAIHVTLLLICTTYIVFECVRIKTHLFNFLLYL
jgi:hypothetical protein